ncbi:amino acid adenylation domain-containing protein [Pareuzebyella sediminis]|uniref:amino acid adenylation domain-containing protein n=1 Tax=Pareuzebyella sediminis TaxID=2607998 RepID=UPI0011ECF71D|nr:amino acid adenylation domain-containing protein [Pareuzebyella sediminis]
MIYNLSQILEQSAERFPDKEAFKCLDKALSYAVLDEKADQLAAFLIKSGLKKGDRVAIYMNRCLDTAIAVYGILRAGGVFVAINPLLPANRSLLIINDCGIEFILTTVSQQTKVKEILKESPLLKVVGLSDEENENWVSWNTIFTKSMESFKRPTIVEEDLASILYTSGSTGVPKGIMHSHKSLVCLAKLEADLHHSTHLDIIGNFAPLHFDQSLFGYFSGPLVGATTVIFPDAYVKLPASLSMLAAKEKITLWFSVPLILMQVLMHGDIDNKDFSALRYVRFGGEVFPVNQLRTLMKKWPHVKFINSYGPSEVARCTYNILVEPPQTDDPIPLGTVWGNTEYKILDEKDQEVKKGDPGELVVRTGTRMIGYWNNKALTEKSFFRISQVSGYDHIYYRTGDLVRENRKEELMFLGRIDRQIKLRGYRIELDEIEAVLQQNEKVNEVAVIVTTKEGGDRELEAVIRPVDKATIDIRELILFCSAHLPTYSIPQKITLLDDFPRTGSGKIDRNAIVRQIENNAL